MEVGMAGPAHHKLVKRVDSSRDSDDNIVTLPTSKGGIRRKHQRAWTLSEVIKLVKGVSRYGVGRWSEIKWLAFASYSYRTSVDLKVAKSPIASIMAKVLSNIAIAENKVHDETNRDEHDKHKGSEAYDRC